MSIFQHIPENLFSPLSSSLKEIYADLLFLIYDQHKKTIYTLERQALIDLFIEYLENREGDIKENIINDIQIEDMERDSRERAQIFLRRLIDFGWLIQEQNHDYTFRISLPDYSFLLLESLEKIKSGYKMEFQGRVLSVYQNLTGDEASSYIAINQAKETTEDLMKGLKSLNHSIKLYTEKLLKTQKPHEIIEQILVDYYEEILGEQYYRLKTSDHISKYRAGILKQVKELRHNRSEIINQAEIMVQQKQASSRMEGENMLYEWLEFIEENFQGMDEILNEIDNRNRRYVTSALERLEFQMAGGMGTEEKIKQALRGLSKLAKNEGEKQEAPDKFHHLIHLYPQRIVDDSSLKNPPREKKEHKPSPVKTTSIDEKTRSKNLNRFKERVKEEITIKDINQYVMEYMGARKSLYLHDFPRRTRDHWVKLIYIILYQNSKHAAYKITGERGKKIDLDDGNIRLPYQKVILKEKSRYKHAHRS